MSTPCDRVLSALRKHGQEPKRAGKGWICLCPAHDDRNPSLGIDAGDDGRALVICRAGCTVAAVCGAIGLRPADLFADDPSWGAGRAPRLGRRAHRDNARGPTFATAREAVAELERRHGPRAATWTYTDAEGDPVGLVLRWNTPAGKDIRPVSRTSDRSGWRIGGMPTPRPLYALPELLAAPAGSRVYVTEGEKAADAARAIGLVATTSAHGAKAASGTDWSPVSGRDVVILPDHDAPGERYAADVARLGMAAGARSVRIVRLVDLWADLPEGGDMVDLIAQRGGDVETVRAEGEALVNRTEPENSNPPPDARSPPFVPFPTDVLPEPIRRFVASGAQAIGCDASYVALPMLSALAAAIGNTHRIELKRGWTEPAIVWTAIVGDSGTAKSPALELALDAIRKRQHEAMKRHETAMEQHRDALAVHERDAAKWKRSEDDTPPPVKPDAPIADRCWTDDTTTEALAVLLQQTPRGLLMARDELSGWFNFDRYAQGKGGDVAKWLEMFGGRPMVVDRKSGGTLYVPRAAVSIAGGIQPEALRRALGQEHRENGLAARLLLTCPPRKPKRWTEADVDPDIQAAVSVVFDRLFGLTMEVDPASPPLEPDFRPRMLTLAPDGKEAWVRFFDEHAGEQVDLAGELSAVWSKLEGYAARFALVFQLTRWAAGDPSVRDPMMVDGASIAAGIALARWFGNEAKRVYAILGESDDDREHRRLIEWIERKGGVVTVRDLMRGPREYRTLDRAEKALRDLVAAGIAEWVRDDLGPKGGRPTDRARLVARRGDTGDGDETPVNVGNRANCVTVTAVTEPPASGDGRGDL